MADVSRGGGHDRAQLILVGGLVVAFTLVALVVLLNTVLFAENVATRGLDDSVERAQSHATFAERAGARILRAEGANTSQTWTEAKTQVSRSIARVANRTRLSQIRQHGATATISVQTLRRGAVLWQVNETRQLVNDDNGDDWRLATNTAGVRNFTMVVNATKSESQAGNFTVVIEGDSATWSAEIYEDASGNVELTAEGETCSTGSTEVTINWTNGSVAGCRFPFARTGGSDLAAPYTVRFENGSNATGSYYLVVANGSDAVETANFNNSSNPRQYPTVYDVVLQVGYEEGSTDYDTHIRIAPKESEATSPS